MFFVALAMAAVAIAQAPPARPAPRPAPASAATPSGVDTVIALIKAGMSEARVIQALKLEGKKYTLSTADLLKLSSAGVRVTSSRYSGTIHDFMMLNALADTPAARAAIAQTIGALKTILG